MKPKHDILNSAKLKEARHKRLKKRIALYAGLFVFLIGGLAYLSGLHALTISKIDVSGNGVTDTSALKQIAADHLQGKYLHLFAKNDFLLYQKRGIQKDILSAFPRIQSVEVRLVDTQTLAITVVEYQPAYLWCGKDNPAEVPIDGNCYFLNENGYVFSSAPNFSGDVYFKLYGWPNQTDAVIGTQFLPSDEFKRLLAFKDQLVAIHVEATSLFADPNGDYTFFLGAEDTVGTAPQIIFRKQNDFQKLLENLSAAFTQEPLAGALLKKFTTVKYLDLRFDDKVYYKLNGSY